MSGSHSEMFCHFVWTTKGRQPLLIGEIENRVYVCIREECAKKKVIVIALNRIEDHIHLFARLPAGLAPEVLAKQVKGASSHLVSTVYGHSHFRWQQGYGVFSISPWDVRKVKGYVAKQVEHHANKTTKAVLEPD